MHDTDSHYANCCWTCGKGLKNAWIEAHECGLCPPPPDWRERWQYAEPVRYCEECAGRWLLVSLAMKYRNRVEELPGLASRIVMGMTTDYDDGVLSELHLEQAMAKNRHPTRILASKSKFCKMVVEALDGSYTRRT